VMVMGNGSSAVLVAEDTYISMHDESTEHGTTYGNM
jgi:PHD/YefM family antitoxin component YafN of YafNO toxin-antitoxin module